MTYLIEASTSLKSPTSLIYSSPPPPPRTNMGFHEQLEAIIDKSKQYYTAAIRSSSQVSAKKSNNMRSPQIEKFRKLKLVKKASVGNLLNGQVHNLRCKKEHEKNQEIQALVEQIWPLYDLDGNGTLDKEETYKFVTQYMQMIGCQEPVPKDVFEIMFSRFDNDGSGEIEKHELYEFIENLMSSKQ